MAKHCAALVAVLFATLLASPLAATVQMHDFAENAKAEGSAPSAALVFEEAEEQGGQEEEQAEDQDEEQVEDQEEEQADDQELESWEGEEQDGEAEEAADADEEQLESGSEADAEDAEEGEDEGEEGEDEGEEDEEGEADGQESLLEEGQEVEEEEGEEEDEEAQEGLEEELEEELEPEWDQTHEDELPRGVAAALLEGEEFMVMGMEGELEDQHEQTEESAEDEAFCCFSSPAKEGSELCSMCYGNSIAVQGSVFHNSSYCTTNNASCAECGGSWCAAGSGPTLALAEDEVEGALLHDELARASVAAKTE